MATPPTRIASGSSAWNATTNPRTTPAFLSAAAGDVVVAGVMKANALTTEDYSYATGADDPFFTENTGTTSQQGADTWIQTATGVAAASTLNDAVTTYRLTGDSSAHHGICSVQYRGSDGIGTVQRRTSAGTTPSFSITTQYDNSALLVYLADWSGVDASTRTHKTINGFEPDLLNEGEIVYYRDAAMYTLFVVEYPDTGVAGTKTIGLDAPTTGDWMFAVVEIRGTTAAPPADAPLLTEAGLSLLTEAGLPLLLE